MREKAARSRGKFFLWEEMEVGSLSLSLAFSFADKQIAEIFY